MVVGHSRTARSVEERAHVHAAVTVQPPAPQPVVETAGRTPERDSVEGSPAKEVALHVLHMRSAPLMVANRSLVQGLDSARRLDALEWLVQAFDALKLPDTQLFAAFGLLDRYAASSPTPIAAGPGAFALVLAAMLVALKVAGTQRDLDAAKKLVVEVSGSSRPWASVRRAELSILRRLSFRACTPTARDLLDRLINEALAFCGLELRGGCADLSRFLLELGLVHEPEVVYGPGRPPLASALAALLLSLLTCSAPRRCTEALQEPLSLLDSADAVVSELAEAMRLRWISEQRRSVNGTGSAVMQKWSQRVNSLGRAPPTNEDLRRLIGGSHAEELPSRSAVTSEAISHTTHVPPPVSRGSIGRSSTTSATEAVIATTSMIATTATASEHSSHRQHRYSAGDAPLVSERADRHARGQHTEAGGSTDGTASIGAGPAVPGRRLPTPRPALGPTAAPAAQPAQTQVAAHGQAAPSAVKYPPAHLMSQLSRAAASENLSSWPPASQADVPQSPQQQQHKVQTAGSIAKSNAAGELVNAAVPERSPEPLVELTHVLNMVAPRPSHGNGQNAANSVAHVANAAMSKPRPLPVAAELAISSALRMQWPTERRRVGATDAATACRDAAAVLQEAAAQLLSAAAALESGGGGNVGPVPKEQVKVPPVGSDSKRRRTFGGLSPSRAGSPGAGVQMPRGSPPVRFSGLRV